MENTTQTQRARLIEENGLRITSVFVPFSASRNAKSGHKSLNWTVTLWRNDRQVLTTEYSAGIAHCPAYKKPPKLFNGSVDKYLQRLMLDLECEEGKKTYGQGESAWIRADAPILPDQESVIYSLLMDSDVLDHTSFEEWAENLGYSADSREAEKIHKACLEIALKLRAGLGEKLLSELREAFSDY